MVHGIDVSKWQGVIDWPAVAKSDQRFAIVRVKGSEGGRDETAKRNLTGARNAGLAVGVYGFVRMSENPSEWATDLHRASVDAGWTRGDLRPVIDAEAPHAHQTIERAWHLALTQEQRREWLTTAIATVERLFGVPVIIYTNRGYWSWATGMWTGLISRHLWVARYTHTPGVVDLNADEPWPTWSIHQYTSSGHVPGIAGRVDLNVLNDHVTLDDLRGESVTKHHIIPRSEWGARPANRPGKRRTAKAERVQTHHSVTGLGGASTWRRIQDDHLGRGWVDIAYTFGIDNAGNVYEGRPVHLEHGNFAADTDLSVCFIGCFHPGVQGFPPQGHTPSAAALDSYAWLLAHGFLSGWWERDEVIGHRDGKGTSCPGDNLYPLIPEVSAHAKRIVDEVVNPPSEETGDVTPDQQKQLDTIETYLRILVRHVEGNDAKLAEQGRPRSLRSFIADRTT